MRWMVVVLALGAGVVGAQEVHVDGSEALRVADRAFCAETRARGVEGWLSWFAPEALVFPPVGPIAASAAERELFFRGRPFPPAGFQWEPDEAWLAGSGDLGFTRGAWSADPARPGEARPSGRYLSVWTKRGASWRVLADLGEGAPAITAHVVQHRFASADDSLRVEAGVARGADGRAAKFLRLWKRAARGELELAHEIGAFDEVAPRLEPWPEADRLFRSDPRWRGGDGASSVDLGGERVLWLFADSFVAAAEGRRQGSRMVRNSIAIQSGRDPLAASMSFHWSEREAEPRSFFTLSEVDERELWLWPASGALLGDRLLLFFFAVRPSEGGLGFALARSRAALVETADAPPASWRLRWIEVPGLPDDLLLGGGGCVVEGEHLYALSPRGPEHALHTVRFSLESAAAGELEGAEIWCGERGFFPLAAGVDRAKALFAPAQSELALHRAADGSWCALHGFGFGRAPIGLRTAPALTGPWSSLRLLHRPEEAARERILIYAAKLHPSLACPGGIAATYVANSTDFAALLADESLYFPRFLRLRLP